MVSATSMIRARRWEWIGHVLHREPSNDRRIAMSWTPPGTDEKEADQRTRGEEWQKKKGMNLVGRVGLR